ncbi:MAG: DUF1579 domain-containing protein [Williamsia sp.]|nr:DUF1579 domain-containing protein [Williamsia sp.]
MKRILIPLCAASILFACNNNANNTAGNPSDSTAAKQAGNAEDDWIPVDSATAMKTMMEAGTPGKEQAMLAKANGSWKAETTMWMSPDAPPTKATGMVTNKMIMGGRYQQMTFKGNMMGAPFEGISTTGYDMARKVWTSSWIDNMSTGIINMDGSWDEATKTVTYTGKMLCPANGKMCDMKQVMKIVDDNTQLMEMYGPDMKTGKQFKNMEMKLTKN